jgi:hypothetical protein
MHKGKRFRAVCGDGVVRSAVVTANEPWCVWSISAAVQVTVNGKRRTVSGSLYYDSDGKVYFGAYSDRANYVFMPLTRHKPRLAAAALRLIKATAYGHGAPGYIWDYAGDHAAAIAMGCRLWCGCGQWPQGGFAARAVLKRLPAELLPRLAAFFDKLAALYRLHDNIKGEMLTTPPPLPVE